MTANTITNGGFETGDLTGWTSGTGGPSGAGEVMVSVSYANGSNYGARLETSISYGSPASGDFVSVEQPLTLDDNFSSINFDINPFTSTLPMHYITQLKVSGNWVNIFTSYIDGGHTDPTGWESISITKDSITGYYGITLNQVTDIKFIKITLEAPS
jgi:hypothetical protein